MASRMIDPRAIKELLNENIDDDAGHLAILTTHGTLLAHSPAASHVPTQRSLSALIGLTWRRHAASLSTHKPPGSDIQHVKTLRLTHAPGDTYQLKGMIIEWENIVAAVEEVKAGVLVAAQRSSGNLRSETVGTRLVGKGQGDRNGGEIEDGADVNGINGSGKDKGDVSEIRRLELRAQGIAEAVAVEWPGPLPEGFY